MALKQIFDTPAKFQANVDTADLDLSQIPIRLAGTTPLDLIDDFNDGVLAPEWAATDPGPVETGGFLQFDYPETQDPVPFRQAVHTAGGDGLEFETRVIWDRLGTGAYYYTDQLPGIHLLQGDIQDTVGQLPLSLAAKDAKLACEVLLRPGTDSNNLSILPIIVDENGTKLFYSPPSQSWIVFGEQGGFFLTPFGQASGVPVTITITPQPNGGVVMKAIQNDDPGRVVFETSASPPVRTLPGKVHLMAGNAYHVFESRFRYDYFKLSGDRVEPPSGHVTFRRQFGSPTKITGFTMDRVLPAPGDAINVKIRSGDTLAELQAAAFSDPLPTTVDGNIETGQVALPAAQLYETQLEFISASPGPELNSFDLTTTDEAVEGDRPVILSLDEVGPGPVQIQTSEGETDTANTKKLEDGDPATQYESADQTDGNEVGITIFFENPEGGGAWKNINAIILRNTNLKGVRIELGPAVVFDGELTSDDEIVTFPTTLFNSITVVGISTKTPNQKKRIGEVYVGRVQLALPEFDEYEPRRVLRLAGSYESIGGKLISYKGVHKYASRWVISRVPTPDKDSLEGIFAEQRQVTFWPEPKAKPRDLYDVAWTIEELPSPYSEAVKTDGHSVEAEMTELEGRT